MSNRNINADKVLMFGKALIRVDSCCEHDENYVVILAELPKGYKPGDRVTRNSLDKIQKNNLNTVLEFPKNENGMKGLETLIWNLLNIHSKLNDLGLSGYKNNYSKRIVKTYKDFTDNEK